MKAIVRLTAILFLSILTVACATTSFKVPDKYNLDSQLEEATDLSNFRLDSWESIDYQSLILRTDINNYYLLILQRPARSLPFAEDIGITLTADKVKTGYDDIIVTDSGGAESYIIHKIYRLKDREQASEIKKQLNK